MCLATFAVSYEPNFGAKKTHDESVNVLENTDESDPESDEETSTRRRKNEVIKLENKLGHMKKERLNQYYVSKVSDKIKNLKNVTTRV